MEEKTENEMEKLKKEMLLMNLMARSLSLTSLTNQGIDVDANTMKWDVESINLPRLERWVSTQYTHNGLGSRSIENWLVRFDDR